MSHQKILLTSSLLISLTACSNNNNPTPVAKNWYLTPETSTSGASVNGIDIASGKLSRNETDLSSSTLNFSRQYISQGATDATLGGWQHNYSSKLDGKGNDYANWQGTKTSLYSDAEEACTTGWNDIKADAYNGKLINAQPLFHKGLCDLYLESEIVASLPVKNADGSNPYSLHSLTRPDGTTHTFFKKDGEWVTTTRNPLTLKQVGDSWQITTPSDSTEIYNARGQLTSMTNTAGQSTTLNYNEKNQLTTLTGHFGRTIELSYQNGKLDTAIGADGTTSYHYDNDKLTSITKKDGTTNSYTYTDDKLTAITDALGHTIATYSYDAQGRVTQTAAANQTRARNISYSADSVTVTDTVTNATDTYHFSLSHGTQKIAKITDTDGNSETRLYDTNGYPAKITAKNGAITQMVYDYRGLLVSRTTSAGTPHSKTNLTDWHPNFRKPTKQVEPGKVTFSEYNSTGLLTKRIEGAVKPGSQKYANKQASYKALSKLSKKELKEGNFDIRETSFEYTENGQSKGTIAANGAITENNYDQQGNRTASKNALGHENKTLEFDATGKALKTQDANGIITTSEYDIAGRIISTTNSGQTTSYEYDSVGRQTKITYPDGSTIQNEYDEAGNLIKTIDQNGNITESSFDGNGNQTANKVMDANGSVLLSSQSQYNNKNQLIKSVDALGNETTYEYDQNGNQTKITDAKGNETNNEYDAENRIVKTIDPLGGETSYEYDINSNRTQVIAPNGATTSFEYDNFNQLIKEISPDRGTTTYGYDVSGNQIQVTDANGNIKNISYDLLNRKIGENWTNHPELTIAYEYDTCRINMPCKISDNTGSTILSYDDFGRVTQRNQVIGNTSLLTHYQYAGNDPKLQSMIYPSGKEIRYSYNNNVVSSITLDGTPLITDISYNVANQLLGWKWSDGTAYIRTYDLNGRLKTFSLGNETRILAYDELGNITGWTDSGSEEYKSFQYDELSRLIGFSKNKTIQGEEDAILKIQLFNYDSNGNRSSLSETEGTAQEVITVYSILENSNRLAQVDETQYQYDNNGNIINDGTHTYSYDARNRLTGVNGTHSYLFNGNDMRVKKVTPTETILYGWTKDRIFGEYTEDGNPIQETVYFDSIPIALIKDNETYRIYTDQIDTPRILTDRLNNTRWKWSSSPFGELYPDEDVDKDGRKLTYNLRFPGQYYDSETGTHYNFYRDYSPSIGRYIQSDPIGMDRDEYNTYTYRNPINAYDLYGKYTIWGASSSIWNSPTEDFNDWLTLERNNLSWIYELPGCPQHVAIRNNAPVVPNYWQWDQLTAGNANSEHAGATYEFRSNPTSNNHGNQCTYDSYGNVMTTIPAAGTADYKAYNYSPYDHFWHDLDTWWLAKYLNRKEDYYSVRPIVIEYSWF